MSLELDTKVQYLKGVGPKLAEKLHKLGIETIRDLVFHWPRLYLDYTQISKITDLVTNGQRTIRTTNNEHNPNIAVIGGRILGISNKYTPRQHMKLTEAVIEDGTGSIKLVWFNQPFLKDVLKPGSEWIFRGKVNHDFYNQTLVMESPTRVKQTCILPVYPETRGISSGYIAKLISSVKHQVTGIKEFLPEEIIEKYDLWPQNRAIESLHQPKSYQDLQKAQRRLAFDELFLLSLRSRLSKNEAKKPAQIIKVADSEIDRFIESLPFELTGDQKKAAKDILADMSRGTVPGQGQSPVGEAMNRLLNGDVGSGKTVVAAIAAYATYKAGYRTIVMVPTEVLATQHYETFCKLFADIDLSVGLMTSSIKKISNDQFLISNQKANEGNEQSRSDLALGIRNSTSGETKQSQQKRIKTTLNPETANIVIGTHALLQDKVKLENIGLVVVDEQHRFGVAQRAKIGNLTVSPPPGSGGVRGGSKIENFHHATSPQPSPNLGEGELRFPHFLSMTATPIPRTMHLALFGDLDVSVISEKPKNRKEIKTRLVEPFNRQKAYDFIRLQIKAGRQVFVICPLIEESEEESSDLFGLDKKSVIKESERLQKEVFTEFKVAMLHGKMKSKEKEEILADFAANKTDILVSTSVIEVGIDIPNASVMMIEDAERFGVAQIHQFRGRVGRGEHQSFCFLFSNSQSDKAMARLKNLEAISDGFKLAEIDLETRGPGDILGTLQSGQMELKLASFSDRILMTEAGQAAKSIVEVDPTLARYQALRERLNQYEMTKHFE